MVTPDPQAPCPDPAKVTHAPELELLAELYCTSISGEIPPEGAVEQNTGSFCYFKTLGEKNCATCKIVYVFNSINQSQF